MLPSISHWETQGTTTERHNLTPTRTATQKSPNQKTTSVGGDVAKLESSHTAVGTWSGAADVEESLAASQNDTEG